jgi:hypothetical protein
MEAAPLQSKIMILMSTAVDITIYTTRYLFRIALHALVFVGRSVGR